MTTFYLAGAAFFALASAALASPVLLAVVPTWLTMAAITWTPTRDE